MSLINNNHTVKTQNVSGLEFVGTVFIIFLGSALHFTFVLSGNNSLVGFFSAVNESVWEHLKLAFWPSFLWMLIVMFPLRKTVHNFFVAKMIGAYVMVIFIPAVFYSYTAIAGKSIFAIDIASFLVAVIIGQLVSYKIYKRHQLPNSVETVAIMAFVLLAVIFIVFTFYPPHLPIFQDPNTSQYGI